MAPGAFFSRFPFRRTSSQDIGDSTSASYGLSTAPPPTSTSRHQLSRAYSQVKSTSSLRRNAARWSVTSSGRQHHHNNNNVTPTQTNERTVDDLFRRPLSHLSTNDTQERRKSVVGKQAITAASSRNSRIPLSPAAGRKPSPLNLTDVKDKLRSLTRQTRSRSRRNSLFDGTYSAGLPLVQEAASEEDILLPPRPRSSSPNTSRPRSLVAEPLELLDPLGGGQSPGDDSERTHPLLHSNPSRASLYENVGSRPLSLKLESPPPQLDYPYIGGAGLLLDDIDDGLGGGRSKRDDAARDDASEHEEMLPSSPTTPRLHDPSPADDLVPPRRRRRPESPPLSRNVNSWPDSTTSTKSSATLAGSPRDSRRGAPLPPNPFPMEMERMSFPPTASSPTTMSLSSWQGSPCWTPSPPPPPLPHLPPPATAPAPAAAAGATGSASPSTPSTVKSKATITPAADSTTQAAPALVLMSDVWTRERMAQQENNNSGYIGGEALRRRTSSHHSRSRSRSPSPSPTLASWTRRYYGGLTGSSSSGSGTGGVIGSGSLLSSRTMKKYMTKDASNESGAGRGGGSAGASGQGEGSIAGTRSPNGLGKPAMSPWSSWRGEDDVLEQRKRGLPPPPRPPRPHDRTQNGSGGSGAKSKQAFALGKGKGKSSSTLSTAFTKGEAARPSSAISAASSAAARMRRRPGTSGTSSDIVYVTTTRDEPARARSPHPLAQTTTSSSSPLPSSSPPPSSRGSGRGIAPVRAPPPPPTSPAMTLSLPSDTKRFSQRLSAAASSNGSTPPAAASSPSTSLKATTTGGMLSSSSLLMG